MAGAGELVLATRNDHKLREFGRLLPDIGLHALPEGVPSPEETGATFADNALIKARAAVAVTGRSSIADDSGIESEALGGAPGVRSARYAGEDATDGENLAKLRAEAPVGSRLRYVCVIAHVAADGTEHLFEGTCEGTMSPDARGEGGFGYDPIFLADDAPEAGRTMAELTDEQKDAISHRGRAARALHAWITSR
jgi:XTP/dITP diphosphohydrolase